MSSSNFFRGARDDDVRHRDRTKANLKSLGATAPPEYGVKIAMKRVYRPVVEGWVSQRVTELLGFEDDIVVGLVAATLQEEVRERRWRAAAYSSRNHARSRVPLPCVPH